MRKQVSELKGRKGENRSAARWILRLGERSSPSERKITGGLS
jgi:hypothetical protein